MSITLKPYPEYKDSGLLWLGKIPKHWTSASVKRHYAIQLGKMLQGSPASEVDRLVPYLKAQHVQWFSVRTEDLPTMWVHPREIEKYRVLPGDLLVCEGGEGGRCGIARDVPDSCIIQNALHRVRVGAISSLT
jgi:type I restriction enzyme S subunit